jgi:hypothetical protein
MPQFRSRELPLHFLPTFWGRQRSAHRHAGHERPCVESNMLFSAGGPTSDRISTHAAYPSERFPLEVP